MRRPEQGDCFYCQPQKYGCFTVCPRKIDPEDVYNKLVEMWACFKCDKNKIRACLLADLNSQTGNNCLAFYYLSQTMLKRRYYIILNERWSVPVKTPVLDSCEMFFFCPPARENVKTINC